MPDDDTRIDEIEERRRRAGAAMSVSYMSDAKWRKALNALASVHPGGVCRWKLLREREPIAGFLPDPGEVEERHLDCFSLNVHYALYRDIEWLEIPAEVTWRAYENAPLSRRKIDLVAVRAALEGAGSFELANLADGLRLYGYRP